MNVCVWLCACESFRLQTFKIYLCYIAVYILKTPTPENIKKKLHNNKREGPLCCSGSQLEFFCIARAIRENQLTHITHIHTSSAP